MKIKFVVPFLLTGALFTYLELSYRLDTLNIFPHLSAKSLEKRLRITAPPFDLQTVLQAVCKKHNVKEAFVKSIIRAESGFKPEAISPKGAIGLMQLMPTTAHEMGAIDPAVPEQNVDAGTKYLSILLNRYRTHKNSMVRAIAAYNAGPGWVDKYKGIPPFPETKAYVTRVLKYYHEYGGEPVQIAEVKHMVHKRHHRVARPAEVEEAD